MHRARITAALPAAAHDPNAAKALYACLVCGQDFAIFRHPKKGLMPLRLYCDRKHCRACARSWSADLAAQLLPLARRIDSADLRHVVLTIRNAHAGQLHQRIQELRLCWREWRNQGRRASWWNPKGYVAKWELSRNREDGSWHPHIHILLHQPGGLNLRNESPAREAWARLTARTTAGASPNIWIAAPDNARIALEVAKYAAKPLELSAAPAALAEAAGATHGLRWLSSQDTLGVRLSPRLRATGAVYLGTLRQALKHRGASLNYEDALCIFAGLDPEDQASISAPLSRYAAQPRYHQDEDDDGK